MSGTDGKPVPGARIEVWEADEDGFYDVQYADGRTAARAHLFSGDQGDYRFWALTATLYPIPHDGPVGELLKPVGRSPMRALHLHFMVTADGKRPLVTHIFVRGDELLTHDAVFGVKGSSSWTLSASLPALLRLTAATSVGVPGHACASISSSPPPVRDSCSPRRGRPAAGEAVQRLLHSVLSGKPDWLKLRHSPADVN